MLWKTSTMEILNVVDTCDSMEFVVTKWQNIFKSSCRAQWCFTLILEWVRMQGQIWFNVWITSSLYSTITRKGSRKNNKQHREQPHSPRENLIY
jgi:hypothetical protein